MLEQNIFLQIFVLIFLGLVFLTILESFGFLTLKVIKGTLGFFRVSSYQEKLPTELILRIFLGGLIYTLVFFILGSFGQINNFSVQVGSIAIPAIVFLGWKRWAGLELSHLRESFEINFWIILGIFAFLLLTFVFWFRPITNFDGLWYHLTVPKLFLQDHSIADQGSLIRYSLQPSLNYFWNLWPLSLPISTEIAGIVSNTINIFVLTLGIFFASQVGKTVWAWSKLEQFLAPLLLGATYETFKLLGVGGNDLLGLAYGLVAALFIFYILRKGRISWLEWLVALLLIVGLASIKIFFDFFAAILLIYLLVGSWEKLAVSKDTVRKLLILACVLFVVFCLTFLPWLVRSYLFTGRVFDPVGLPGLNESVYREAGSMTGSNHWSSFIFERFYVSVIPLLTFVYSPLVFLGLISVANENFRKNVFNLWFVALGGLILTFFASIILQWRYYLPEATILIFLGIAFLFNFLRSLGLGYFGRLLTIATVFVFAGVLAFRTFFSMPDNTGLPNIKEDLYVSNYKSVEHYVSGKLVGGIYDYVQEKKPDDLLPEETIFIGNGSNLAFHNLAYVKNPFIENHTHYSLFKDVQTVDRLIERLKQNSIRYILVKHKFLDNVCQEVGINVVTKCSDTPKLRHVLYDKKWNVDWYQIN